MEHTNPTCRAEWILAALMRLEGPLTRYSLRLTGNVEQARDVVQEAFLRLCREDPAELDGRLDQWLFTVCRNQALDVRRKEQRMTTAAFERVEASSGREIEPAHAAEQSDDASLVAALVGQLPVNQQEVVRLKFQNSLSYREISEITGLSISNVGFLLHHALKTLRTQVHAQPT